MRLIGKTKACAIILSILLCASIGVSLAASGLTSSMQVIPAYGAIKSIFPLHVSGNQILDANNNTIILKGIARMGLEYDESGTSRETNPAYYAQDFALMKGWGANFIRIAFNRYFYNTSSSYRSLVQEEVNACIADGFFVLLDMHWFQSGQFPDGVWTNADTVPANNTAFDIENETVLPWLQRTTYPIIRTVVQDYNSSYYNGVIGFEINEFWPDSNRSNLFLVQTSIMRDMADYVHINCSCPKYLMCFQPWVQDQIYYSSSYRVPTSDSQKIVYAFHFYIHPNYSPWFGGFLANSTYDDGWNWTAYYESGDFTDGKIMMYRYLDNYYTPLYTNHNVPVVFDEIGVDSNCAQGLDDMLSYFDSHGYGYNYWAWYGGGVPGDNAMNMLYSDWISIRPNTYWLIKHMSYKHFFQWQNTNPTLTETYNWTSGTVFDQLSFFSGYTSNYIFSDGFESGNFSAWTSTDSNAMVTSSVSYQGNYSAMKNETVGDGFGIYKTLGGNYSTIYLSFDYCINTLPQYGNFEYVASISNGSGTGYCALDMSGSGGSGLNIGLFDVGMNPDGSQNIQQAGYTDSSWQPNKWYSLEMEVNASGAFLWENATLVCSTSNIHVNFTKIQIYCNGGSPWPGYRYVDNVKVATSMTQPDIASYSVQFYALNVTANTRVTLSNGTTFAALPYWNSTTKLLTIPVDPAETSITISDPALMPG